MITFEGTYFDGKSSRARPVTVTFDGRFLHIGNAEESPPLLIRLDDCTISPPLGKTSFFIKLPGGAQCETNDADAIAALQNRAQSNRGMRLVHFFESRWRIVAGAFLGLVLCVWAFMTYGIPFLAKKVAYSTPPALAEQLSSQTMKVLDARFLTPSKLDRSTVSKLKKAFKTLHKDAGGEHDYRLEFRRSPVVGPNAFALPSGLIIMTDELVKLAKNNRELEGILLHEIAHVRERHGLRMIVQDAGVFLLISFLVGDITSITSVAGTLPTLLAESRYSRKFEREADESAALYFISKGWSAKPYRDILLRITKNSQNFAGESLLSSHPLTDERIQYLRNMESSALKKRQKG